MDSICSSCGDTHVCVNNKKMSRATTEDQLQFLICCVRHSNNGRVDFAEVANEFNIISKGAAAKRYERLLKTYSNLPSSKNIDRPSGKSMLKEKSKAAIAKAAAAKRKKIEGDLQDFEEDYDEDQKSMVLKQESAAIQHSVKLEPFQSFSSYPYPPSAVSTSCMPMTATPGSLERTDQQKTHDSLSSHGIQLSSSTQSPANIQSSFNMPPPPRPHHQLDVQQPLNTHRTPSNQQDLPMQSQYQMLQPLGRHQGFASYPPYQTQQYLHMNSTPYSQSPFQAHNNLGMQTSSHMLSSHTPYDYQTVSNEMMQTHGERQGSVSTSIFDEVYDTHGFDAPQVAVGNAALQSGMIKRSNSIDLEVVPQSIPLPPQEVVFKEPESSVQELSRDEGVVGANYIFIAD